MKTSCIRHPDDNVFVIRRDWQLMALETGRKGKIKPKRDNTTECAAEILSVLEYHYNNRQANRMYRDILAKIAMVGKRDIDELGDWMPYSLNYIQELLLNGRSIGLITSSLELLLERKFISKDLPVDLQKKYGGSGNRWFRLEVTYINEWIDLNVPKIWQEGWRKKKRKLQSRTSDEVEAEITKLDSTTKIENTIFSFYKHIHGKNDKFVFDSNRRSKVKARLKEKRSLGEAAQAILGNLMSDYHQARHENNRATIYDDIELIFRHAKNFENHIGYALNKGITEEIALNELEGFVAGKPSRYAKRPPKDAQTAGNGQQSASVKVPKNAKQYREFALAIAPFFATNVDNKQIAEFCTTHKDLQTNGEGLIDAPFLAETIASSIKTYRQQGPTADMARQITEFADAFCQIQAINMGDE